MVTRDRTRDEIAEALGVQPRTVTAWVAEGCPCDRKGRRLLFNEIEVRAWRARRGGGPVASAAQDDGPDPALVTPRDSLARAELARKLTVARKNELELAAERSLKDLPLADRARNAKTIEDLASTALEALALVCSGQMTAARGRTIQGLLGEARHGLKDKREVEGEDDQERLLIVTLQGHDLLDLFEGIVSDERRAAILAHVRAEAQLDLAENPNTDTALEPEDEPPSPEPRRAA